MQLQKLFDQQPAKETAVSIRQLLDNSRECVNALQKQNVDTSTWDCILIYIISHNIPPNSLAIWEQSIPRNTLPTFNMLLEFLKSRFRTLGFSIVQHLNRNLITATPGLDLNHFTQQRPVAEFDRNTHCVCVPSFWICVFHSILST